MAPNKVKPVAASRVRCPKKLMPSYLFHFAHAHNEFRLPELKSIAELYGFPIILPRHPDDRDPRRPCIVIELEDEGHARILANRCILVKYILYL